MYVAARTKCVPFLASSRSNMDDLLVQKLTLDAIIPTKGSTGAAGYDLYAVEDAIVCANNRRMIGTGIAIMVPVGHYGRIAPRSGLALRLGIHILGGVIDSDYTGEVKVLLHNHGDTTFCVSVGDRIAQLIIEKISLPKIRQVESLKDTVRGKDGFGSTGN